MKISIEQYRATVSPVRTDDLDLEHCFEDHPLDEDTLRCLRYMHDVEYHTSCYLRDMLVTKAHRDPEVTDFLTFWLYEEYWHGDSIGRVLRAHGETAGLARIDALRGSRRAKDIISPMAHWLGSLVAGRPHLALQMTWGAINEWTTQAGYVQLARLSGHPKLATLLRRIARQEGRHIDFYASRARRLLEPSRSARRVTRGALERFWKPVGSGVLPPPEVDHLVSHLFFSDAEGRSALERIDRCIDSLPGLADLGLIARHSRRFELA
jgi:hypothetical protein